MLTWTGRGPQSRNPPHQPASHAWAANAAGGPATLPDGPDGLQAHRFCVQWLDQCRLQMRKSLEGMGW